MGKVALALVLLFLSVCSLVGAVSEVAQLEDGAAQEDEVQDDQTSDLRQRSDEAALSISSLKSRRAERLAAIRQQRAVEMARLKSQHAIELAAEKQQASFEWKELMRQHRLELDKLKARIAIRQRVAARVTEEVQLPVMKSPEVHQLLAQQKQEATTIKTQRHREVTKMVNRFKREFKSQQTQQKRDIAYAMKKYAAKLKRREEQLAFYRFQEAQKMRHTKKPIDLGEGVDSMSPSSLRHHVVALQAALAQQQGKYKLLLDASSVAMDNTKLRHKIQQLTKENALSEKQNVILRTKLKTMETVLQPKGADTSEPAPESDAEAVLAVP